MTAASSFPFAKSQNRVGKPLFSKENIPLGLAGMPGLFQPRMDLCCLACSVKKFGVQGWLMRHFEQRQVTVMSIIENGYAAFDEVAHLLTDKQQRSILAICRSMLDTFAGNDLPIAHENYYQARHLEVISPFSNLPIGGSKFSPGQMLEIYFNGNSLNIVTDILTSFKEQAWDVANPSHVFPGLNHPHFDKCLFICQNLGPFGPIFDPNQSGDDRCEVLQYQQLKDAQRQLVHSERVSLIVIDKITVDPNNGVVTGVRDWIEMMSSVDSIDNLFLIFLVEAEEFYQIDITTFSKMRTLVNQGLSELMRRRVLCLEIDHETLNVCKLAHAMD